MNELRNLGQINLKYDARVADDDEDSDDDDDDDDDGDDDDDDAYDDDEDDADDVDDKNGACEKKIHTILFAER